MPEARIEGPPFTPSADSSSLNVLIVDDEKNIRSTLRLCLEGMGARVTEAATAEAARAAALRQELDLAFVDLRLGPSDGLSLLPPLLAENPLLEIVVITAHGTIENAVEAIQLGRRRKGHDPPHARAQAARPALAARYVGAGDRARDPLPAHAPAPRRARQGGAPRRVGAVARRERD